MAKELLFSLTAKDFVVETFRSGGPGGQNQNKVESGVRIKHPDSGAVAESREFRSQYENKQAAFKRLVASPTFKTWHKLECARRTGRLADIEDKVNRAMSPHNLTIEGKKDGRWVPIEDARES